MAASFCLFQPFGNMLKAASVGYIKDYNCPNCTAIVASGNSFKTLLARLLKMRFTVSQIWSLMLFYLNLSILAPN